MIARRVRARSGITLTEILISILIMGIGMISLAVLFPLGLLKLRDAARAHRSGLLAQSATDDFDAKSLLTKETFIRTWYGPVDPFTSDTTYGIIPNPVQALGANVSPLLPPQPGLVVCYDPLWRALTGISPPNDALYDPKLDYATTYRVASAEARFGAALVSPAFGSAAVNVYGINFGSQDTQLGLQPSAYGMQRISNFIPFSPKGYTPLYPYTFRNISPSMVSINQPNDVAADTFTSLDDVVFNSRDNATSGLNANGTAGLSPLLPDLALSGNSTPVADYRYSWFFTGRQVDSVNGTLFQGDVVVCDSRPFGFAPLPGGSVSVPAGETVVEAIFGYSTTVGTYGFASGADRTVLLRWPSSLPDPMVRIGGWIADVTYERSAPASLTKELNTTTSFQRCYWYQVTKRSDSTVDPNYNGYRQMILTLASPVKAKTLLTAGGRAQYSNVALVMPCVINVYSRAFSQ